MRVRMRERVAFQRLQETGQDGAGNLQQGWDCDDPILECQARLRPIQGQEEVLAQKLSGVQPFELVVPWCRAAASVTTADRAVNMRTGEAYDIVAIQNPDERRRRLSMIVKKGVASG